MKQIAAGIVLLALATPSFAGGAAAKWQCGAFEVWSDRGNIGVVVSSAPRTGKVTFDWDFRAGENLTVNGKRCERTQ